MSLDPASFRKIDTLILPNRKAFYPAKILEQHWQLRSRLSSPHPDILYYPSGTEVFRLNTISRKRQLVAVLPFDPQCMAAAHGYVCVGGANEGEFAAIKINSEDLMDYESYLPRTLPLVDVETIGPWVGAEADLRSSSVTINIEGIPHRSDIRGQFLGGLITNSVTIFQPEVPDEYTPLAVISNNDKTIKIFSLSQFMLISSLDLPFPVNYATISPNGEFLVAVGDEPVVHFYKRAYRRGWFVDEERSTHHCNSTWNWAPCSTTSLRPSLDGCFTAAFSPSSHLCAVASQDGLITIFDMKLVDGDDDAVIKTMPSSRPYTKAGAVRSLFFSPAPWDLMFWTEHSGRICIADARDGFRSRQVIELSTDTITNDRLINVTDVPTEEPSDFNPRGNRADEGQEILTDDFRDNDALYMRTITGPSAPATRQSSRGLNRVDLARHSDFRQNLRLHSNGPSLPEASRALLAARDTDPRPARAARNASAREPRMNRINLIPYQSLARQMAQTDASPSRASTPLQRNRAVPTFRDYVSEQTSEIIQRMRPSSRPSRRTADQPLGNGLFSIANLDPQSVAGQNERWQLLAAQLEDESLNNARSEVSRMADANRREPGAEQERLAILRYLTVANRRAATGSGTSASAAEPAGLDTYGCAMSDNGKKLSVLA
ncbi:MAG: hypothetical protein M1829_002094 [Trizodia sp. TS-e1964]|nr:MAG: hypothetical protein M1829_002094 [Trizodia sp. TS-e1964]